jgi:hypothetical protein
MRKLTIAILSAIFVLLSFQTKAQQTFKDWTATPVLHKVISDYTTESAVILEDQRTHLFSINAKNDLEMHVYNRRLIKVNDDKGIEMFNKIYVYVPAGAEIEDIKARAIQPSGKVVNLPNDKILDEEDEGKKYKKFAIEGLEKGSEIEYLVHFKKDISTFGLEVYQSSNSPIEKASFTIITPDYLQFLVKGYNGFTVKEDSVVDNQRIIVATEENINAQDDEKYASPAPYQKNVQYKLAYNLNKDKNVRLFTWNELAKNVYNNYNNLSSSDLKAIANLYKQINIPDDATEETKIILIEDYLKTNINTSENTIDEDADKIDHIIKTKVAGNFGFTRLLIGLFAKAGINNEIVFPSNRDGLPLDENFENYKLVDDMLIYFPGTGNFIEPTNVTFRYPFIEPYHGATTGLFLKGTSLGDFKTAIASFDTIPLQPYEKNAHNMEVSIKFTSDMDSLLIHSKQSLLGYGAAFYRPAYIFLTKDKQDDFTKDIIKSVAKSDNIKNIKVENSAMTDGSKNLPLNIIGDITTDELIEKAGTKILLKVGDIIGQQEQLYQEKKRTLPVLIQYPHNLDRLITFTIPDGYQIKNLNDINITQNDDEKTMGFNSSYTLNGNQLVIKIHEYYKVVSYPLSQFEAYRKVVNASADFNKVILVLEKK